MGRPKKEPEIVRQPVREVSPEREAIQKRIKEAVSAIRAKFGHDAIRPLSEVDGVVGTFSTGIPGLDDITEVGGYPLAKIVQIIGAESVGKTTLINFLAAQAQRAGYAVHFLDGELAEDKDRAAEIGVDLDLITLLEPETLEKAFQEMSLLIEAHKDDDKPMLIMLDSLASLPLQSDQERDYDDGAARAGRARFFSENLNKFKQSLKGTKIGIAFVNQVREKANAAPFEKPTYSPGGRALRHASDLILEMKRIGQKKEKSEVVGIVSRIRVEKSRIGRPYGTVDLNLFFDGRIEEADGGKD